MSQTKVQVPSLSPSEYDILIHALKFFHEAMKETAISKNADLTFGEKAAARADATLSKDLLEKIG